MDLNLYTRKKRWKWILFGTAVIIVAGSLWYTNILVREIAREERVNIQIWADAIHRKASLVNYTEMFYRQLQEEERKRAELLAETYKNLSTERESSSEILSFYLKIIQNNNTIPIILTDEKGNITNVVNVDFDKDTVPRLRGRLLTEFTRYRPIRVQYLQNKSIYLYYKESILFNELREMLDDLIESFFSEVVINSASVPVIITDSTKTRILESGMIDSQRVQDSVYMIKTLSKMASQNKPIEIELSDQGKRYIFYKDSELLTHLIFFPYFQLAVIGLFLLISYILFSSARKSEQNQVWVGLARETAHQLGTPLSSMIAWVELLKMDGTSPESVAELEKDVVRLEKITDRFSKIGSDPRMERENIVNVIYNAVAYIRSRTSRKMEYFIEQPENTEIFAPINLHLFEWVIENLCKNAVDATGGNGRIEIGIFKEENHVVIDITDNGKGIPKSKFKTIFNPGYTSKKRGWGLGLSLSQRIIRDYHKGKIFVKSSGINKGTTFRIMLKKER
ncbi:MAG: HAMP domain-containing histidine kinase [Bacteroidales bacterium]|nr:HAMP domain-containing histidine kinase [Bacteroidales bacterium]